VSRYGAAALAGEIDRLELAGHGFRHRTLFSAACHLGELIAGGELDLDTAEGALIERGLTMGLLEGDVRRQVARGIAKGRTRPRKAPSTGVTTKAEALAEIVAWWEAIHLAPPTGRTAGTTLRILAGFHHLALGAGKLRISQSYREIAEAAGVSVSTVVARRPEWSRWVRLVSRGRATRFTGSRTTWQLVTKPGRAITNSPASPEGKASGLFGNARSPGLADPVHNLWHRWGNGHRIYCLLNVVDATSTSTLATTTGLHPGTVRRIGARLLALGVVTRDEDGWRAAQLDISEVVYLHLAGVDHAGERRARHVLERDLHRRWLAQRVAAAELPKLRLLPTQVDNSEPAQRRRKAAAQRKGVA
jgi:hypothetical protein